MFTFESDYNYNEKMLYQVRIIPYPVSVLIFADTVITQSPEVIISLL